MKIPFDIKFRPQIESGECKVILDCGVEVEILAWDKPGKYPIVCMAKKDGAIPFRTDNNGIAYHYPEGSNYSDLFIITSEPELSEFEEAVGAEIFDSPFNVEQVKVIKEESAKLLSLARNEIVKSGYAIIKSEHYLEEGRKNYERGKSEALKDLPMWRKCADCTPKPARSNEWIFSIDSENVTRESAIVHNGYFLPLDGLEKLPKEE